MTETILRRPYAEKRYELSLSTIYKMMTEGRLPRPIRLGKRAVGWRESDVARWWDALSTADAADSWAGRGAAGAASANHRCQSHNLVY